eukprot:TRINITY_DN29091_c0_g1_i1.p2 TRINITY_DN29091_c0_g1~~TRINITY_DN29091_c0_g1_i1.p2  ORF type:complete len:179 (-),score=26.47 TRINITY_DN29091_c0_g1_i1:188-724(-)
MVYPTSPCHIAFRGNQLHGCPAELERSPGERLSLLVNIWVHHRPMGLHRRSGTSSTSAASGSRSSRGAGGRRSAGRRLRVQRARGDADGDEVELQVRCGPLMLSGLRLPRPKTGTVWAVPQRAGVPFDASAASARKGRGKSSPGRPRASEPAEGQAPVRKRPASTSAAAPPPAMRRRR